MSRATNRAIIVAFIPRTKHPFELGSRVL